MSKTTKIIAALGVVAGLGVAALPAFTFAEGEPSVSGDVEVLVEVQPAIAMTITGNNDGGTHKSVSYTEVETPEAASMSTYYERSGTAGSYTYTLTSDVNPDPQKTYYTKDADKTYASVDNGVAGQTVDNHTVPNPAIAGLSSSWIEILPNDVKTGNNTNNFRSTITVYTNATAGYQLVLQDKDATNALTSDNGSTIPATEATTLTAGTPAWGYQVETIHGGTSAGDTDWHAVPTATTASISSLNTKTSGGDQTIVDYGVATDDDQAAGIYSDIIVYTATCN